MNGVQAYYRAHERQMHLTDYSGTLTDMRARVELYRDFLSDEAWGQRLRGRDRMLQNALRSTSREAVWCSLLAGIASAATGAASEGNGGSDFSDFAHSQYPPIERTLLWRELHRRQHGQKPLIPDSLISHVYRLKWAVKWRRWRQWGL